MNPHNCRIVLRPRGPFEVLDLAFLVLRRHRRPFLTLAAWTVLPPALILTVSCWLTRGAWVLALGPCLLAPLIHAPATVLAGRLLFSERATLREAVTELGERLVPLGLAWLQVAAAVALGIVSCGALLLVAGPAVAWVTETALLERIGSQRALRRSMRLAAQAPAHAVAASAGWVGITMWGGVAGEAMGQAVVSFVLQLGTPFGTLVDGFATPWLLAGMLVVQPLYGVWRLLLYVDARTRAEGWDLQVWLRAAGLGARA
jgi:hypothetical protein